jgi:hypothetical protein
MLPPVSRVRSWLRAGLALVLAATFGARVAALPAAGGCPTGESKAAAGHAGHHAPGHHAPGSPAPSCICVAHGSGIGLAVDSPRPIASVPALPAVSRPGISDHRPPLTADRHLLPFPIGPPALLG